MTYLIGSRIGFRSWMLGATLLAVAFIVATPYLVEGQSVREAEAIADDLDARTYTQVESLRQAAGLTSDDLATLDVSGEQAEAVLTELVAWTRENQRRLDAAEAKERLAARELREAQRRLAVGPADQRLIRSMPEKAEAVHQARSARQVLRHEGVRRALAGVRPDQRQMWEDVYGEASTRQLGLTQYRGVAALSGELRGNFQTAKTGRAVERDEQGRSLRESSQLQALRQARRDRLPGVLAAERRVLPLPEELATALPSDSTLQLDSE